MRLCGSASAVMDGSSWPRLLGASGCLTAPPLPLPLAIGLVGLGRVLRPRTTAAASSQTENSFIRSFAAILSWEIIYASPVITAVKAI